MAVVDAVSRSAKPQGSVILAKAIINANTACNPQKLAVSSPAWVGNCSCDFDVLAIHGGRGISVMGLTPGKSNIQATITVGCLF